MEENLGLRYMASSLESGGHQVEVVPFNTEQDIPRVVEQVIAFAPQLTGFSAEPERIGVCFKRAGRGGRR